MAAGKEKKDEIDSQPEQEEGDSAGFKSYLRIFSYADRTSWALYGVSFVAAIAAGAALPFMDLIFGKFVTVFNNYAIGLVTPSGYMSEVEKFTLYLVYLFVAKFVLVYIHSYCVSIAAIRTTKALRIHFLQSLLRQDIPYFDGNPGSASIKVTTNGNLVNNGISEKLSITIQCMSTFIVAFVIALAVQWKLTLITICIIPAILVVTSICIQIDVKLEAKLLAIYSQAGQLAEEVFSSITTVHSFWLHPVMAKRYDVLLADAEEVGNKKSPNYGVLFSTEYFCIFCGYALAFYKGIRMYASGEIAQPGSIVTVIFAVVVASTSLTQIAPQILHVTKAASAADELFRTIDRISAIDPMSTAGIVPDKCTGDIALQDLKFAYPSRPETEVLGGISLKIPSRKTTALVGASGSGKSTIVALLERWYDQTSGTITIDGVETRQLNVQWLRTRVRLVQQEPVLFSGTVFENVANGLIGTPHASASDDEKMRLVEQACKDAYAHEFIEQLPLQYLTPVGERARMLSGGQKQRIAIARSIISNPPILLLDEATSALDPKAEKIVQDALDNVSANRTTITIAHKLSTIQKADNIAVMSKGAIIEQGTHSELIARGGAYARLVRAQDLEQKGKAGSNTEVGTPDEEESVPEEDEKARAGVQRLALARTQSAAPSTVSEKKVEGEGSETLGLTLVRCLFILVREQPELWYLYAILASVCIIGGLTFPAQAILFARTFSVFQSRGPEAARQGDFWALMFFVVALANLFAYFVLGWTCNIIIQRVTRRYRLELFATTMKQEIAFFDADSNATGAITSRLSSCATNLQELLGINSGLILINLTNILSSSILGIVYGWKLGLVCVFGALPPLVSSGYLRIRLETKLEERTEARFASSAALAAEAVAAIRTVASLAMEGRVLEIYSERLADVAGRSARTLVSTMFWYALTQSVNFLAMALGFWYGGKLVSSGEYNNEQFFVVFIAVIFGGEAAAAFFQYTTSLTKAGSAANYILWLRQRTPLIPADDSDNDQPTSSSDTEKDTSSPAPSLACNDLTFAYPSRPKASVIKGINITVRPGSFIALVGPSGCGKSTMIALLSRFYDPRSGSITVDDTPVTSTSPRLHRRRLALVQQEPVLYQGSVRDNVAMGVIESRSPSDAEVQRACASANILEFVQSLPEGLDTSLGNRGLKLSGGQRQRIAIARALIRDPKILLLDEATSALDTESEKVVQAALVEAASEGGRSTVAVAHRLSTIKEAECIFVFAAGRIVEAGSHRDLVEKRGVYWEMCLGQALDKGI